MVPEDSGDEQETILGTNETIHFIKFYMIGFNGIFRDYQGTALHIHTTAKRSIRFKGKVYD